MDSLHPTPGPAAARAYRLGLLAAAIVGLAGTGLLYWSGVVTPLVAGYSFVLGFPVYLVFVALLLGRWLGYHRTAATLRPVTRTDDSE